MTAARSIFAGASDSRERERNAFVFKRSFYTHTAQVRDDVGSVPGRDINCTVTNYFTTLRWRVSLLSLSLLCSFCSFSLYRSFTHLIRFLRSFSIGRFTGGPWVEQPRLQPVALISFKLLEKQRANSVVHEQCLFIRIKQLCVHIQTNRYAF